MKLSELEKLAEEVKTYKFWKDELERKSEMLLWRIDYAAHDNLEWYVRETVRCANRARTSKGYLESRGIEIDA